MFWFGIVCFIVMVLGVGYALIAKERTAFLVAFIAAVIGAASFTVASYNKVPTRNVGIVTSFGKQTGKTTGAGLHWTKPWQNVEDWDASGQTYDRLGANCLWVNIAAQRRACIAVQIEYNANPATAPELWSQYKPTEQGKSMNSDNPRFGTFVYRRVNPQIDAAITSVFASFDPLGTVSNSGDAPAPDLNKTYKQALEAAVTAAIGQDVQIRTVAFGTPTYDTPTTNAIAAYGQKMLEARNLAVDQKNAASRKSLAGATGVPAAVQQCLDIADSRGKEPGLCMGNGVSLTKPIG